MADEIIIRQIQKVFDDAHLKVRYSPKNHVFTMAFPLHGKLEACCCQLCVKENHAVTYSTMKPLVPENRRLAAAEFLMRANFNELGGGLFELDFSDGSVDYRMERSYADVESDSKHAVQALMVLPSMAFNNYADGLSAVIFDGKNPADAVKGIAPLQYLY